MAGFFNFSKEGRGISKDAREKNKLVVFFRMFKTNFWKFIPISLVYLLISLPLLTNGLANAGITNVTRNIARDKHSFGMSDFFETIKKNWKQSLISGIINVILTVLAISAVHFYYTLYTTTKSFFLLVGFGVIVVILVMFVFAQYYMWTLIITFNLKLREIYINSFKLAVINLWRNLLVGILLLLTYAIYYLLTYFLPYSIIWVIVTILVISIYNYIQNILCFFLIKFFLLKDTEFF